MKFPSGAAATDYQGLGNFLVSVTVTKHEMLSLREQAAAGNSSPSSSFCVEDGFQFVDGRLVYQKRKDGWMCCDPDREG